MAFVLIGGTGLGLAWLKGHRRLGIPGVKTSVIANSPRLDIYLPEKVLDYESTLIPTDKEVLHGLPQDTSFMQRRYISDTDWLLVNVVLMGTDRTSIHKPQFCLTGSGWNIDATRSSAETIRVERPKPYDLPVMRLVSSRDGIIKGQRVALSGIYVYWFVADHELTERHGERMWRTATHLLKTGELQRWAYVSCFAICQPGNEEATYARMKKFIAAAVPQFQLAVGQLKSSNATPGSTASN